MAKANVVKMKEEPKKTTNVLDVLAKARVSAPAKKSSSPVLAVPLKTKEQAQEIRELKMKMDDLKAELTVKESDFLFAITPLRKEYILSREYVSSVKVPTTDGLSLTVVWSHAYLNCPPDNADQIVEAIGEDRYIKYFDIKNTIKVKDELPIEKLEELINKVGTDVFAEFFDVETNIRPNDRFKYDQFTDFTDEELEQLELAGVKQKKAAIKAK